ncbi:MAG: hypothetical protein NC417_05885 [Candidatus Gastranaerophilales bacterium]|nr:hypothetical protein [Candidatus Gastranaerophilales bacterium]
MFLRQVKSGRICTISTNAYYFLQKYAAALKAGQDRKKKDAVQAGVKIYFTEWQENAMIKEKLTHFFVI